MELDVNKALVVFSGGLDSTTALYHAKVAYNAVQAISFDYGQRHLTELMRASRIAHLAKITHNILSISGIGKLLESALTVPGSRIPHGHYADESMKATVVPMRNSIMLSIATGVAISRGYGSVIIGVHAGDHPIYPDCRPEFVEQFQRMARIASDTDVVIEAPFMNWKKEDIVLLGYELGVPFRETWSCYEGANTAHCGKCGTCVERKEAFQLAGVTDPTEYLQ